MTSVGIIGATGYAGAELVRILTGHPHVNLTVLTSRQYAGTPFSEIYPCMLNVCTLTCEEFSMEETAAKADIFFMALPHQLPMHLAPGLLARGKKVIDLSADFRFSDPARYESCYQEHTAKELLQQSVYGLTEIYREEIRGADIVGNPGCYPTSILLPLIPLLNDGLIHRDTLIADAKSGVSGAGRTPALATHHCEVNESFKAYKVDGHRHNPEIDEVLTLQTGRDVHVVFVPHLVPMTRGMLSTIYAVPQKGISAEDVRQCLQQRYQDSPFVRILPNGRTPDTRHVNRTNFCDIGFHLDQKYNRLVLLSAIDNLVKGAAGQAVQNMNIMTGYAETAGLDAVPFPL
jgi:N-acetyl-gamma-glutamyl-phosphate reductase